ncbi:hypothetical protein B0H16DRAFT_1458157 [Mycena metata]|uniref:Uncharacterized protein n=1 Tax=Mycena metata TaxID=1033252 RepID=A0AAD7NE11_9AGAR|nr:hypothetical protein B0H16DRAFT_1458157 [Mycena metata]
MCEDPTQKEFRPGSGGKFRGADQALKPQTRNETRRGYVLSVKIIIPRGPTQRSRSQTGGASINKIRKVQKSKEYRSSSTYWTITDPGGGIRRYLRASTFDPAANIRRLQDFPSGGTVTVDPGRAAFNYNTRGKVPPPTPTPENAVSKGLDLDSNQDPPTSVHAITINNYSNRVPHMDHPGPGRAAFNHNIHRGKGNHLNSMHTSVPQSADADTAQTTVTARAKCKYVYGVVTQESTDDRQESLTHKRKRNETNPNRMVFRDETAVESLVAI